MKIPGKTIKYASHKKNISKANKNNLLSEINTLEKNLRSNNYDNYLEKKSELQTIR